MNAEHGGTEGTGPFHDPDLIDRRAAADLLHCGLRTLHSHRRAGHFPDDTVVLFRRLSGGHPLVRYRRSKLEEFERNDWRTVSDVPDVGDSERLLEE